jgi:hypothetical protein
VGCSQAQQQAARTGLVQIGLGQQVVVPQLQITDQRIQEHYSKVVVGRLLGRQMDSAAEGLHQEAHGLRVPVVADLARGLLLKRTDGYVH